jgi:hypothetical protein
MIVMLTAAVCHHLRSVLAAHDYTVEAVVDLIGEPAHRALGRNSTVPALRVIDDRDDPLALLTRLWLLQRDVPEPALEVALPGLLTLLLDAGILTRVDGLVRAAIDVRPYASDDGAGGWVVSDLTPNLDTRVTPVRPDFVLGVSSASSTLAQLTLRHRVDRALDLGTGCGVQSLHLARHADQVVATDLNPRAVELARLTAMINDCAVDLRVGDLYAPVASERFDLITSNPPYVISPPSAAADALTYREGQLPADGLVQRVITEGVDHLADDGVLQVLGNWAHRRGQDWAERLSTWVDGTGCDVHIVQREVLDPSEYAELWLADAGLAGSRDYTDRFHAWLDYFDDLRIEAVGLGWLVLHRAGHARPSVRIEHWPHAIEQPIARALAAQLTAVSRERGLSDTELLNIRWALADDVTEETIGRPGAADPQHIVLRQQRGFRRAIEVDTATAGILGACDGELTLGQIVGSVAELLGSDVEKLSAETVARVRQLVVDGFLR